MAQAAEHAERIGDLLIRSNSVTAENLSDAARLADKMSMPLGRVFEMNGYMTEKALATVTQLQDKIDAGEVSLDRAIKAVEWVTKQGIDVETALRQLRPGYTSISGKKVSNKIGDLMSLAGVVTPQQLNSGMYDSLNTGLPLGMVLVEKNMILPSVLEQCLSMQRAISTGRLSQEQAAHALRTARLKHQTLKEALQMLSLPLEKSKRTFGLGELLVLSNVMTETQLLAAQEMELVEDMKLESVMIQCGMASKRLVDAANTLLPMILKGVLFEEQAAVLIRRVRRCKSESESDAILNNIEAEIGKKENLIELDDLFERCRIVDPDELDEAKKAAAQAQTPLIRFLIKKGLIASNALDLSRECKDMIDEGSLDIEQARIALTYAVEEQTSFADALAYFGWNRHLVTMNE